MRRSLSSGLRWLIIGQERIRYRRPVPQQLDFSILLAENEDRLITEDGAYLVLEQPQG